MKKSKQLGSKRRSTSALPLLETTEEQRMSFDNLLLRKAKKFAERQEKMYPDMYSGVRGKLENIGLAGELRKRWQLISPEARINAPVDVLKAVQRGEELLKLWESHKRALRKKTILRGKETKRGETRKSAYARAKSR